LLSQYAYCIPIFKTPLQVYFYANVSAKLYEYADIRPIPGPQKKARRITVQYLMNITITPKNWHPLKPKPSHF